MSERKTDLEYALEFGITLKQWQNRVKSMGFEKALKMGKPKTRSQYGRMGKKTTGWRKL